MINEEHLVRLIRENSPPLEPLPVPALPPELEALVYPGGAGPKGQGLGKIGALLFDIYGTLFCSAAGDIAAGGADTAGEEGALKALARRLGWEAAALKGYFRSAVESAHRAAQNGGGGGLRPEVRVERIWDGFPGRGEWESEELALCYELALNPVYPMPGAEALLRRLREAGLVLGLISNAQFFTPLLFRAFFGASPAELGFDPELLIYSFEEGWAKPSPLLFTKARKRLEALGIEAGAALYVGNDMYNDIYGASQAGFKTLLFAGDRRSLRLREGGPPSGVIRHLTDILGVLGLSP